MHASAYANSVREYGVISVLLEPRKGDVVLSQNEINCLIETNTPLICSGGNKINMIN